MMVMLNSRGAPLSIINTLKTEIISWIQNNVEAGMEFINTAGRGLEPVSTDIGKFTCTYVYACLWFLYV